MVQFVVDRSNKYASEHDAPESRTEEPIHEV